MNIYLKVTAGIITALILWLCLSRYGKDMSVVLTMAVCAMALTAMVTFLQPIISFIQKLRTIADLDENLLSVIIKAVGIGLLSEICSLICSDAGNASMGKVLQVLSAVVVLWLSIPVFEKLLTLLNTILSTV